MTKSIPNLLEFAASRQGTGCLVCDLPEDVRRQIERGKKEHISYLAMIEWLKVKREDDATLPPPDKVTKGRIERHFQHNHELLEDK